MFKYSKLSVKLGFFIILMILLVEVVLLFISYEKKCDQLIEMQKYEKSLYGENLIYNEVFIERYLDKYSKNILLLSLFISLIVSIGFIVIYQQMVGRYLSKISSLNKELSPLKNQNAFKNIPKDEMGDLIRSRIEMLSRIDRELKINKNLLRILSHDLSNLLMISFSGVYYLQKNLSDEKNKNI